MPLTPVTATSVTELSAAASWNAPEFATRHAGEEKRVPADVARSQRECTPKPLRERKRAAVRRVPDVRRAERRGGDAADRDHAAAARQLLEERP